jgi:serine/threonine-protein kinase PRP4
MASPSPSASEGEIVEFETDKASTARPTEKDMHVDRHSRHSVSTATSPGSSIHFDGARYRSRSRSRSPYRPSATHGKKRRWEDDNSGRDRQETRRFKVHYEDSRRHRVSYADIDRYDSHGIKPDHHGRDKHQNQERDRDRDVYRRSRSRSRSPFRHKKAVSNEDRHPSTSKKSSASHQHVNGDVTSKYQSMETNAKQTKNNNYSRKNDLKGSATTVGSGKRGENNTFDPNKDDTEDQRESATAVIAEVDEAAQIEARRKRREALKAKLKNQPTPLLAQALHVNASAGPSTPNVDQSPAASRSGKHALVSRQRGLTNLLVSPSLMSPQSLNADDSPTAFIAVDDEELVNHRTGDQGDDPDDPDEPSAADYDPTIDMKEDRERHDHRFQNDLPASSYDETKDQLDVLMHDEVEPNPTPNKPKKQDFDMFADDDEDDDMFAAAPVKTKAAGSSKPKELAASLLDNWDDPDGYYRIILGELLDGRYHVQANLGKGMFSGVVRALDKVTGNLVAIKIIRSNETMKKAGLKEIEILQKLSAADPDDKKHLIRLERYFEHKGHLCMVFENLSINLREVLKKFGRDVGINLKAVRSYAQQMFLGLSLLKKCNILHADIKPDNILVNDTRNLLKVCDLGSAGDASENDITPYLVSRFYRAPEIILGMSFDFGIDMWSVGCTLFELYTGKILFTGRNNNQMLRSIMECRGKFSLKMLKKAEFAGLHFDDSLMFRSMEKDRVTNKDVVRMINFLRPTRDLKTRLMSAAKGLGETDMKELNLFVDLLDRCLALNPERRITPTEALKHPFIHRSKG